MTESFTLAVIGSPFGLKGYLKVKSLSGETGHLSALKTVNLRQKGKEKEFSVEETMETDEVSVLLMKFTGIDSPEAAKVLTGSELVADRAQAAPLKPGEFYIEDLKGLQVIRGNGEQGTGNGEGTKNRDGGAGNSDHNPEILGHITDILEGGNGEVAEVKLPSGELKMVPFRKEFFGDINIEEKWAVLFQPWILEE